MVSGLCNLHFKQILAGEVKTCFKRKDFLFEVVSRSTSIRSEILYFYCISSKLAKTVWKRSECLASNFSSQYQPWIKCLGYENKGNDHQLKKVLIVKQILLACTINKKCKEIWCKGLNFFCGVALIWIQLLSAHSDHFSLETGMPIICSQCLVATNITILQDKDTFEKKKVSVSDNWMNILLPERKPF